MEKSRFWELFWLGLLIFSFVVAFLGLAGWFFSFPFLVKQEADKEWLLFLKDEGERRVFNVDDQVDGIIFFYDVEKKRHFCTGHEYDYYMVESASKETGVLNSSFIFQNIGQNINLDINDGMFVSMIEKYNGNVGLLKNLYFRKFKLNGDRIVTNVFIHKKHTGIYEIVFKDINTKRRYKIFDFHFYLEEIL